MKRFVIPILISCLPACQVTFAEPAQVDSHTWENVERVVAVGDLHGDYENYIETLELAGLVDRRGRWSGGSAHLVQTGDIADRGPDTRKIMAHLDKLAKQAAKDGGQVHRLIGNHEAMNVYGDLRYVTDEEFADFATRRSENIRDQYFELVMENLRENNPEAFAALPEDYREQWDAEHPPGFIEHQQAWNPAWNPEGEYFQRSSDLKVAVNINGVVFVHGGISEEYSAVPLPEMTERAHAQLADFDESADDILTDTCGPLWYRGQAGTKPEVTPGQLSTILRNLSARRIVMGHTPTPGVIWPRFDGRVIQIDTGISRTYGGFPAYLELSGEEVFAGYRGGKVALPGKDDERLAYLDAVLALDPESPAVGRFKQKHSIQDNGPGNDAGEPLDAEPVIACSGDESATAG